jgi:hypothetical protein
MPKDRQGPRHVDDDVLTGFRQTGRRQSEFRGFFTTLMVGSLYVWDTMFDLGAYDTVLFYREDAYLVLATVTLVGVLVVRREVRERPWVVAAFVPPAALLAFRLATPAEHPGGVLEVLGYALLTVNVVALPLLGWLIGRLLAPEYFEVHGRRHRITLAATLAGVAVAGFLAGQHNYRYLTCEDFVVAGVHAPDNCHTTGHD